MEQRQMKKLLLMGPGGAGKTCMRSIIFDNYLPRDALRLGITISMDQSHAHILRNLFLNLWDCGGQHTYVAEYLKRDREYIFRYVGVMLFVFDISSMSDDAQGAEVGRQADWKLAQMLDYFKSAMTFIEMYSPEAKIFVLLHKIDLIQKDMQETIFNERRTAILNSINSDGSNISFFATSIWTDSLYTAYSSVVRSLIPHREELVKAMRRVATACNALEVALYERGTFLCLAHVTRQRDAGGQWCEAGLGGTSETRTTEISETVKHFKLSCLNSSASFGGLHVATPAFTALLEPFTDYTHVFVVSDRPRESVELHRVNIAAVRDEFLAFLASDSPIATVMREVL